MRMTIVSNVYDLWPWINGIKFLHAVLQKWNVILLVQLMHSTHIVNKNLLPSIRTLASQNTPVDHRALTRSPTSIFELPYLLE